MVVILVHIYETATFDIHIIKSRPIGGKNYYVNPPRKESNKFSSKGAHFMNFLIFNEIYLKAYEISSCIHKV